MTGHCAECGQWKGVYPDRHRCDPFFSVWCPDHGETEDDAEEFRAMGHSNAAEKWAEWSDRTSADYTIVRGSDATVHVRGRGQTRTFVVSGEARAALQRKGGHQVNVADEWIETHTDTLVTSQPTVRRTVLEACVAALLRERDEAEARVINAVAEYLATRGEYAAATIVRAGGWRK